MPAAWRQRLRDLRDLTSHPLSTSPLNTLSRYARWNVGRRMLGTDQVIRLAGDAEIIVSDHENFGTMAYTHGLWDFGDMALLLHALRPGDLFADVGANVGAYSALAGRVAGAEVVAFEPVPDTYARLCRNLRLNGLPEAAARNIGLAETPGTLHFTANRGGLNHVVPAGTPGAIPVPVSTLDTALDGRRPVAIKLDVEGFELPVLAGGAATFGDPTLQVVVVELNGSGERFGHSDAAVDAALRRHGFEPHDYDPVMRRMMLRATFRQDSLNTIYVRTGGAWLLGRLRTAAKVEVRGRLF